MNIGARSESYRKKGYWRRKDNVWIPIKDMETAHLVAVAKMYLDRATQYAVKLGIPYPTTPEDRVEFLLTHKAKFQQIVKEMRRRSLPNQLKGCILWKEE
tara:strand:+ start:213 stop:512 length:300 start_codon:yes stop_codon:yes gene_type:complete